MPNVPRLNQFTAKQAKDDAAAKREWEEARKKFLNDRAKYGYGTPEAKQAWKERIKRTRSF